jgi:hypothetical protein
MPLAPRLLDLGLQLAEQPVGRLAVELWAQNQVDMNLLPLPVDGLVQPQLQVWEEHLLALGECLPEALFGGKEPVQGKIIGNRERGDLGVLKRLTKALPNIAPRVLVAVV